MKIQIVTTATGKGFSVEAGLADGMRHFDHHREHSANPAPCRDERIPVVSAGVVEITHIDADTFVGLLRMSGQTLPEVDFDLMEKIDLNGSSICSNKFSPTLLYMVGIGQLARDLKFPRANADSPTDVTSIVEAMMAKTSEEIIQIGRAATEESETAYKNCRVSVSGKVGFWAIGPNDPLDPSRPYEDGVEVVVVFRRHYESISIYCDPRCEYTFGGKMVAGIEFAGHPKAAGSPRGVAMTEKDGLSVFEAIRESLLPRYEIAEENGIIGMAVTIRAEINLGLKKGYGGFLQEKQEVIDFLKETYIAALLAGRSFVPVGIQQTEIVYAYPTDSGPFADAEPALTLFSDKNPLYAVESDEDWKTAVERLAAELAEKFQQFRVYVSYIPVEVKIFQKQ